MGTISKPKRKLSVVLRSSQLRYAIAYILITSVVLVILNIYTSATMRRMIFTAQEQSLESKAQLMTTALLQLDELTASGAEQTINGLDDMQTTRMVVTDQRGRGIYDSLTVGNAEGKLSLFPEIVSALKGNDTFRSTYQAGAIESRISVPLVRGGITLGAVYLMQYDTEAGALISAQQTNVLRITAALEAVVVLISLVFSAVFSRRVRRILNSIRFMRDGDYSHKIKLRGSDEVAHLSREFNTLADRLAESEQRRRQFVSDASHELKTPLASIKLLSDSILQNEMDAATEKEFIGDIGREADRLGRLSQKLLTLTKLDSSAQEEREIIDATPTVEKVVRMLRPLAQLREIRLLTDLEPACGIMTVEDDLYQIVFNLVENAIKYNREKGIVDIILRSTEDEVLLKISDTGVGIPPEELDHIFERFYRVDKARSRAAGGAGLGLSIVHDMVVRNYGTITVEAGANGGTVFSVKFPSFALEESV